MKARYVGVCRGCGAYTQPRNGKGDAYPGAIELRWTREPVLGAMREWRDRYATHPSLYDWSRSHARRRGGEALERRAHGELPAASVVTRLFRDRRGEASVAGGLMERRCRGQNNVRGQAAWSVTSNISLGGDLMPASASVRSRSAACASS